MVAFVVWTAYVWCTRIANAWGDAGLSTAGKVGSTVLSLSLLVPAAAVAVVVARRRRGLPTPGEVLLLRAFGVWTIAVWVVRVPMILVADHDVPFKVVHAVLGVVSIALALVTLGVAGRAAAERAAASDRTLVGSG